MAIDATPPTTPSAMAPVKEDEDEAGPCPLLLVAAGDVDADVDADVEFILNLGMVFLKMAPKALSLSSPGGTTNVGRPGWTKTRSTRITFLREVDLPSANNVRDLIRYCIWFGSWGECILPLEGCSIKLPNCAPRCVAGCLNYPREITIWR